MLHAFRLASWVLLLAATTTAWGASFSSAAPLATARQYHTETLLPNGKVLVAGGSSNSGVLTDASLYDPATNTWSAAGSLSAARYSHSATLLPNGKVLVAGGFDSNGSSIASVELYDPAANTWSVAASLTTPRAEHTATLMASGKVLVAGGDNTNFDIFIFDWLPGAELYDPAANTWSAAGSLVTARNGHTATLLPSGKVLVAGGVDVSMTTLDGTELYDPAANSWSAAGTLAAARNGHTATLLPSGKVLVTAGYGASSRLASAELYDPATNTSSATGSLGTARSSHTATLLPNGKVLAAAGYGASSELASAEIYDPAAGTWSATGSLIGARSSHTATLLTNGKMLILAGYAGVGYLASAELYDPAASSQSAAGALTTSRFSHTATTLTDGTVLVAGGEFDDWNAPTPVYTALDSAERYNPATNTWSAAGTLAAMRFWHAATLLFNGKVLVTGGFDYAGNVSLGSAELYDPAANTWSSAGSLAADRYQHTATLLPNGKVLVAGGYQSGVGILSSAELYDPATNTWSPAGSLTATRVRHTATLLPSGKVLAAGGNNGNGAELYDPLTDTWSATGNLIAQREAHTATLLPSGKVLVAGGGGFPNALASAELYDPAAGTWSAAGSLSTARVGHAMALLPNGKVLVAGGYDNTGSPLTSVELYDPVSNTWSAGPALSAERNGPTATLLSNGKILIAGGMDINYNTVAGSDLYDGGLQYDPLWQPVISGTNSPLSVTASLVLTGSRFKGVSEASGGSAANSSPTNYPIVQVRSLVNERTAFVLSDPAVSWSDSSFASRALSGFPPGYAQVTVYTNGIPSDTATVLLTNSAPTDLALSAASVPENSASGTAIGTFSATDADAGETFTYTLASGTGGTDNASFSITGTTLKTAASFNYEVKNSYSIRVRTTDSAYNTFEKAFTISVTDVNEAPSDTALSSASVPENSASGTTVGTLSAADEDAGDTAAFTLVSGAGSTDNASFSLTGTTLKTAASFNYEVKNSYSIRVRATDSASHTFEKALTISVTDVNEAPSDIALSAATVAENSASGTTIGTLSAADVDAGDTFTYTLVSGAGSTDNASFSITGSALQTAAVFDYETKNSYSIRVRVTDAGSNTFEKAFTVSVTNVNEAPASMALSASSVPENSASGTTVGTLSATDADAGDTFTYTLVSGTGSTDNASFSITGATLQTAAVFDFETKNSCSIRVRVTDSASNTYEKAFTISVTDVNEAPTDIALSAASVPENSAVGTTVGTFSATDPDAGDTFTYALVSGAGSTDNASFSITGAALQTAAVFNFTVKSSYDIRVRVTDAGSNTFEKAFTISVLDANVPPTDIALSAASVPENSASGTAIGTFSAADSDPGETFTYALASGSGSTDNASFSITGSVLQTAASFDFETKNSLSIRVRVTDSGSNTFEKVFTISVTDVNEAPAGIALSSASVVEQRPIGTTVGTLSAADPDAGDTFTYALASGTGGTDNASFSITGATLKTAAVFDLAVKSSYSIRVRVTDSASHTFEQAFTITIAPKNVPPADIALSAASVPENSASGTAIGTFSATDPDAGETFSYALASGTGSTDNASFGITGAMLQTAAVFNFEAKSSYSIRVRVTDSANNTFEKAFTIAVSNVDEPPVITSGPSVSPAPVFVAQAEQFSVVAADPDGFPLACQWNFGDGTTADGLMVTHSFALAGSYSATVTLTTQAGVSITRTLAVAVSPLTIGGGAWPDSTGDGVPDTVAIALGADPQSGKRLPIDVTNPVVGQVFPLGNVKAVQSKSQRNSVSFTVKFEVPVGTPIAGELVAASAGSVGRVFKVPAQAKGRYSWNCTPIDGTGTAASNSTLTLKSMIVKRKQSTVQQVQVKVRLYSDSAISSSALQPVAVIFNGQLFLLQ